MNQVERLLDEKTNTIYRWAELANQFIDLKYQRRGSFASVDHISERLSTSAQTIQSIVDAGIEAAMTAGTIADPMTRPWISTVATNAIEKAMTEMYPLIRNINDNTPEAQMYFIGWDNLGQVVKAYADEHVVSRQREYGLLHLWSLSPQVPSFALEEWQVAVQLLAAGDTRGAVRAAQTLIETIVKHILDLRNEEYDPRKDSAPQLFGRLRKELTSLGHTPELGDAVRSVAQGLGTMVDGIDRFRNRQGDAHGREVGAERPHNSVARAAVLGAGAFTELVWQAHMAEGGKVPAMNEQDVRKIEAVLESQSSPTSLGFSRGRQAAELWTVLGFGPDAVKEWLGTDCGTAVIAKLLSDAGFTPADAALRSRTYDMRTIAELVSLGIFSVDEALYVRDQLRRQ